MKTIVDVYRNKRNPHKFIEVHKDGEGHTTVRQFMHWDSTKVTNKTGDGNLHRWKKGNLPALLEDYNRIR